MKNKHTIGLIKVNLGSTIISAVIISLMMLWLNFGTVSSPPVLATSPMPSEITIPVSLAQNSTETDFSRDETLRQREEIYLQKWSAFRGNLGIINIFIILFVTLGPIKIIPTFIKITQNADENLRKNLALKGTGLSTVIILLVVLIGGNILTKWTVSMAAILLAAGVLLFLTSLQLVMSQYERPNSTEPPPEPSIKLLINPLIFPSILTPYGIALALILMIFNNRLSERPFIVPILLILVMILNLIAMLAARTILRTLTPATLQILGLVLGVMQLALGLEIILSGIQLVALTLQDLLR